MWELFNSIMDALCKEGLVDGAEQVLHIMNQQNVVPTLVTYSALIYGYCLQGRLDEVRKVFDSMSCKSIALDVQSFNTLIDGYCKHMKIEEAVHLLLVMERKGLKPNVVTYTSMLQGLFNGGRCSEARKLFDEMQACLKRGGYEDATNFLEEMVDKGFSPNADTLELVLSLPSTVESSPTLCRIAQKLAPKTFGNKKNE